MSLSISLPLTTHGNLGYYLLEYEKKIPFYDKILTISGGFHRDSKGVMLCYQIALMVMILVFFFSIIAYFVALPSMWITYISFFAQCLILFPIITLAKKRVKDPVNQTQIKCISDTLAVCKVYFGVSILACLIYFGISLYSLITMRMMPYVFIASFLAWFGLLGIGLLNLWGMFFIILDAKVAQSEIMRLMEAARQEVLTITEYDEVYENIRNFKDESIAVAEGIAVVAYISIIVCLISLFTARHNLDTGEVAEYHINIIIYIIGAVLLQIREALMILIALPHIAEVNELHDQLVDTLARSEWGQTAPSSIALATTGDSYVLKPNDVVVNYKNNARLNLVVAAITRPLSMYVLGRAVKRTEMKAQLITIALLGVGAFGSFVVDAVVGSIE